MSFLEKGADTTATWVDDRLGSSNFVRRSLNKVFPDHWSFMLGEICLYSFIILLLIVVVLIGVLSFLPALALGPLADFFNTVTAIGR